MKMNELVNRFYDSDCSTFLTSQSTKDDPSWIDYSLDNPKVHDPDYAIFKFFQNPQSTVLDVGANWGYSVTSVLASGCAARIISFEPLACYAPHLTRLIEKLPERYEFMPFGLGEETAELRFVTPVLDGEVLTAYTSASETSHRANLWRNLEWELNKRKTEEAKLEFVVTCAQVRRLDDVVASVADICAIKIDTEGHEPAVISGGRKTLDQHRPLMIIEGANRNAGVVEPLAEAGYIFAERSDDQLRLSMRTSQEANGFFVHRTRIQKYMESGLLAGD